MGRKGRTSMRVPVPLFQHSPASPRSLVRPDPKAHRRHSAPVKSRPYLIQFRRIPSTLFASEYC